MYCYVGTRKKLNLKLTLFIVNILLYKFIKILFYCFLTYKLFEDKFCVDIFF